MKQVSIYDMDGTLVCSKHRYRTLVDDEGNTRIDLAFWRENEFRAMDDSLLPLAQQYQQEIKDPDTFVIIATARVMHAPDFQFLSEKLGLPDYLISRKENDTRSGATLKINGLQKFFNLRNFARKTAVFYEDNVTYLKKVCDHFKIRGVYVPSEQGH